MSKVIAENCRAVSIYQLNKWGCFKNGYKSGTITWTDGRDNKNSIDYAINLAAEYSYIKLSYTITDRYTGEKRHIDQDYPIIATPCHFGGKRYWFNCSVYKRGVYCGRRVAKLYLSNCDYFACRRCGEIAYDAQMKGGKFRGSSITYPDIDRKESELKRFYYKGKPTRKYRRVMMMKDKINNDFIMMASLIDKQTRAVASRKK